MTVGVGADAPRASLAVLLYDVLRFAAEDGKLTEAHAAEPIIEAARLLIAGNVTEEDERRIFSALLEADWRFTPYFNADECPLAPTIAPASTPDALRPPKDSR